MIVPLHLHRDRIGIAPEIESDFVIQSLAPFALPYAVSTTVGGRGKLALV
jgi:hypothetical protein